MLLIRKNIDRTSHYPQSPKAKPVYFTHSLYACHTGLLEIYQQLLSLKFSEVKDTEAWNADVKLVRVIDVPVSSSLSTMLVSLMFKMCQLVDTLVSFTLTCIQGKANMVTLLVLAYKYDKYLVHSFCLSIITLHMYM